MIKLVNYDIQYLDEFVKFKNNPNILNNKLDIPDNSYTSNDGMDQFKKQLDKTPAERFLIFYNGNFCGDIGITPKENVYRFNARIGYWIAEPFWGKGITTEAIKLMTEYAFETFEITRIEAGVFEFNKASMKALEKNGYTLECIHEKSVIKNNNVYDEYIWVKFKA